MKFKSQMSSLDILCVIDELQSIISYRIDNVYADKEDSFFVFALKGVGELKNPQLLIEPGKRIHITEFKYDFPLRPTSKTMNLRSHLKGDVS